MSNVNRSGLKIIAEGLGRATMALQGQLGDTDRNPGAKLRLEAALCRLRGATLFHDDDYASSYLQFNADDPVGLGLQSALLTEAQPKPYDFGEAGLPVWNDPGNYGPPSPEGWGVWEYNQWAGYRIDQPDVNPSESGPVYSGRLAKNYPVLYDGAYAQVGLWERARWISFKNTTGGTINNGSPRKVRFTLSEDELGSLKIRDPLTGKPKDIRAFGRAELFQAYSGSAWTALGTLPNDLDQFDQLTFDLAKSGDDWQMTIGLPSGTISWPSNYWWHVVLYVGTTDEFALQTEVATGGETVLSLSGNNIKRWLWKNFFRKELYTQVEWEHLGINDDNSYLVARRQTNFEFVDGTYSAPLTPSKYLVQDWPQAEVNGLPSSLTGYVTDPETALPAALRYGSVVGVLLVTKNQGSVYDTPAAIPQVIVGPEVSPEFFVGDWADFDYFPPVPEDHVTVGRVIVGRAPGLNYGVGEGVKDNGGSVVDPDDANRPDFDVIPATLAVLWVERTVSTHARPPLGSPELTQFVLQPLYFLTRSARDTIFTEPISDMAFRALVAAARVPSSLADSRLSMLDANGRPSKVFRGMLKKPTDPDLKPSQDSGEPLAVQLDDGARAVVENLSELPPSTQVMTLTADELSTPDVRFNLPTTFELYHDPSEQCSPVAVLNDAGNRIGQDYTLRLVLEDANQNTLLKDWYVMASRYFLSAEEYARRVAAGLSTVGYFKADTLTNINEYRLHGRAGLVPDLETGKSELLRTRVVAPADETKTTEEQFRKNLENQGYSQAEIDDAVIAFLEAGGQFYTVDLRQMGNTFVALRSAALNVARYTFDTILYWKDNINTRFGEPNDDTEETNPGISSLRSDSFTIAQVGLAAGDLESYGTQAVAPLDPTLNTTFSGTDKPIDGEGLGLLISAENATSISSFDLRLKAVIASDNEDDVLSNPDDDCLRAELYSIDAATGFPEDLLAMGETLSYSSVVRDSYAQYRFNLRYTLSPGTNYWLVLRKSTRFLGGHLCVDTGGASSPTGNIKFWDVSPVVDLWRDNSGKQWIEGLDGTSVTISQNFDPDDSENVAYPWLDQTLVYSKEALRVRVGSGTDITSLKLRLKAILDPENLTGALGNGVTDGIRVELLTDSGGNPSSTVVAKALDILYKDITESYAEFEIVLRDPTTFEPITYSLLANTNYWLVLEKLQEPIAGRVAYHKEANPYDKIARLNGDTWSRNDGKFWAKFYLQTPEALAAFNRSSSNILEHLPPPNDKRATGTYKLEGHWSYTNSRLDAPAQICVYPRAIYNGSSWEYVRYSQDIWVCVRYKVGADVITQRFKLAKASGWKAIWWARTSSNYRVIDTNASPKFNVIVDSIDYTSPYQPSELGDYRNAVFEGVFAPTSSVAYDFEVVVNDGVRLYLDDELVLDEWSEQSGTFATHTFTSDPLTSGQQYKIRVEHFWANSGDGNEQYLTVKWAPTGDPVDLITDSDSVPNEPYLIGSEYVEGLVYLAVAKTESELDTPTHGAPPGDNLTLRST